MRTLILAAALLALAACGQSATTPPVSEDENTSAAMPALTGHVTAIGDDFRFDADRDIGYVAVFPAHDLTVGAAYAAPRPVERGLRMESEGVSVTLEPIACTRDGLAYPFTATIELTNAVPATGCAYERWNAQLLELMPAITACAGASHGHWVTYAGREGDAVLVRLEDTNADCRFVDGQASLAPRDDGLRMVSEGEAVFVQGRDGPNPGGECYEAPEVRNASGALVGWMMDPEGC
ncbi:MAG: hypothetical protein R3C16_03070 [Hyphomonadaceae bacterium]